MGALEQDERARARARIQLFERPDQRQRDDDAVTQRSSARAPSVPRTMLGPVGLFVGHFKMRFTNTHTHKLALMIAHLYAPAAAGRQQ